MQPREVALVLLLEPAFGSNQLAGSLVAAFVAEQERGRLGSSAPIRPSFSQLAELLPTAGFNQKSCARLRRRRPFAEEQQRGRDSWSRSTGRGPLPLPGYARISAQPALLLLHSVAQSRTKR